MGKITEFIDYINREKHPTSLEIRHLYTHLEINAYTKEIRKKYRQENKLESSLNIENK